MRKTFFFPCFSNHMTAVSVLCAHILLQINFLAQDMNRNSKESILAYLKLSLNHPFLRSFSVFYFGVFFVCLFYRYISAEAFGYRSYYATGIRAMSPLKQKYQKHIPSIKCLMNYILTSHCVICLYIVTSDLNLCVSLSAHTVSSLRQRLYPVFVEGNKLLILILLLLHLHKLQYTPSEFQQQNYQTVVYTV